MFGFTSLSGAGASQRERREAHVETRDEYLLSLKRDLRVANATTCGIYELDAELANVTLPPVEITEGAGLKRNGQDPHPRYDTRVTPLRDGGLFLRDADHAVCPSNLKRTRKLDNLDATILRTRTRRAK